MRSSLPRSDVFVVGGGPAGLASAIAFAQKGYRVCVGDCALPPIEKACGEGLMPDSQAALRKLGVVLAPAHGASFTGIRFQEGQCSFQAAFPNGIGIGVRRPLLQNLLIERAAQLGVEMRWGLKGLAWRSDGRHGRLTQGAEPVATGFVVAADGHNSPIRRAAGLGATRHHSHRFGYRRRYAIAPWSDQMEVYWADEHQISITPVSVSEVCVVLTSHRQDLRLDEALGRTPEIGGRLAGKKFTSNEMGALTGQRRLKKIWRDGLALAGDASGSVDAITGEGMRMAFKGAVALADAYANGNLAAYQRAHEEFFDRPRLISSLLLALGDSPAIRRKVFAGFAKRPDLFGEMLAIHVGASSFLNFTPGQVLGFGIEFLNA